MLNNQQVKAVCARFGISQPVKSVRVSQNEVFEVGTDGGDASVLRVSRSRGRTLDEIEAELDWTEDLAARGIDVCRPRRSPEGRRCERIECDGAELLAVHFNRAPGRKVLRADVDLSLYTTLGVLTGKLHAASFDQTAPQPNRIAWHQSRLLTTDFDAHIGPNGGFRSAVEELVGELKSFPERQRLVHSDISFGNTFLDGSQLWIFDFDNCETAPVEHDLATVFYDGVLCHFLNKVAGDQLSMVVRTHWCAFLNGYRSVREPSLDLTALRQFVVLREAIIYVHYLRTLNLADLSDAQRAGVERMRENVERGISEVELDERWLV
jgi:Ser/Thr protein kinase RdoA (MazF antagonist)